MSNTDTEAHSGQRIGYLRVSTREQTTDRQADGLRDLCDQLFIEEISAVAAQRPVFEQVLSTLRAGDTLLVWDLDRAFRSTIDAVMTAETLRARGVQLKIVSLNIDTATPEGELYYTIIAAYAQFERRMLSRRTREGMQAAKMRGTKLGPRYALDEETIIDAHRYVRDRGYPCAYIAALLGVSKMTLQRAFRRIGLQA